MNIEKKKRKNIGKISIELYVCVCVREKEKIVFRFAFNCFLIFFSTEISVEILWCNENKIKSRNAQLYFCLYLNVFLFILFCSDDVPVPVSTAITPFLKKSPFEVRVWKNSTCNLLIVLRQTNHRWISIRIKRVIVWWVCSGVFACLQVYERYFSCALPVFSWWNRIFLFDLHFHLLILLFVH